MCEASVLSPGGVFEGLADQLADLFFQGAIIANALTAFAGLFGGDRFGGAFSLQEAGPAEIGAVELGRFKGRGALLIFFDLLARKFLHLS